MFLFHVELEQVPLAWMFLELAAVEVCGNTQFGCKWLSEWRRDLINQWNHSRADWRPDAVTAAVHVPWCTSDGWCCGRQWWTDSEFQRYQCFNTICRNGSNARPFVATIVGGNLLGRHVWSVAKEISGTYSDVVFRGWIHGQPLGCFSAAKDVETEGTP